MDYNINLWFLIYFFASTNGHQHQYSDPYLKNCELQQNNNTYVNNCNRIQELSVVRSFYDNVEFLCVILDNHNGRYTNQIIQMKISKINNYRIGSKSTIKIQKNQYKINEANIVLFAIHSKKYAENELPKIYSIQIGEIELCDSHTNFQNNITTRTGILRRVPRAIKECIVPDRDLVLTVAGGAKVPARLYPWHVSIFKKKDGSNTFLCGGSVISHEYILTAAHCLYEDKRLVINQRLFIRVGSNNREKGDYYGINEKIVHRDFNFITFSSDIALLQTLNEIEYSRDVKPVCFTAIDFNYADMDAWIPGWGLTENQTAGLSDDLNHANMPGRTNDDCEERNPKFFKDYVNKHNNFCAGHLNTTSICRGDSGGGLVMQINGGWYIRGIASFTPASRSGSLDVCDLSQFVVFTDVVQFADWINENIQTTIVFNPRIDLIENVTMPQTTRPPRKEITCGDRPALDIEASVSSGGRVEVGSYPWHAGLYYRKSHGSVPYFCGGTLINSNTVITAGHCIQETVEIFKLPDRIIVKLGTVNINSLGNFGREYGVKKLKVHHNNENFEHDIALLRLETFVEITPYIVPACYSSENFDYIDQPGKVPGWALTESQHLGLSEYLDEVNMPGKSEEDCKEEDPNFYKNYLNIDYQLCAGTLNETSICKGDSGGGLVFQRGKKWFLRGITSISPADEINKCQQTYVVFADVVKHYNWIRTTIRYF